MNIPVKSTFIIGLQTVFGLSSFVTLVTTKQYALNMTDKPKFKLKDPKQSVTYQMMRKLILFSSLH